jgi:hypothetical protein
VFVLNFVLAGDEDRLHEACCCLGDEYEPVVGDGPVRTPVTLAVLRYGRMTQGACALDARPEGSQCEVLLRFKVRKHGTNDEAVFVPFIWVDNLESAAIGRVEMGYPKLIAGSLQGIPPVSPDRPVESTFVMHESLQAKQPVISIPWSVPDKPETDATLEPRYIQRRHPVLTANVFDDNDLCRFRQSHTRAVGTTVSSGPGYSPTALFYGPAGDTIASKLLGRNATRAAVGEPYTVHIEERSVAWIDSMSFISGW